MLEAEQTRDLKAIMGALDSLANELRISRVRDDIWTTEEAAGYLKMSITNLYRLMKTDGFPRRIVLPTGGVRLVADEVRQWAKKQR